MGNAYSALSDEELDHLEECTFFKRYEIINLHRYFTQLSGGSSKLKRTDFAEISELKQNPFRERIIQIFATHDKFVSFDDFIDFFSVFSGQATKDVKAFYAFRIYDRNDDGYLEKEDVVKVIKQITVGLMESEINVIADKVLEEADIDGDKRLSFLEFDHVITRTPDFVNLFRVSGMLAST